MSATQIKLPPGYAPALAATFAAALAITYANGAYSDHALPWVVLTVLMSGWCYIAEFLPRPIAERSADTSAAFIWCALAVMSFIGFNDAGLIMYARKPWDVGRNAQIIMLLVLVSYIPTMALGRVESSRIRRLRIAILVLCVFAAGVDVFKVSPAPSIDVWTVQMEGAKAFSHGENPYLIVHSHDTAPGVVANNVPLVYPPMQLYIVWIAYALFGDVRYAMLIAVVAGGLAIRFIVRKSNATLPPLLEDAPLLFYWMNPKLFFILEQSWTDPVPVALVCGAMAAFVAGKRTLAAVIFGIFIAAKQTVFFFVPLSLLLGFEIWQYGVMGGVVVAAYAPYLVWDFHALKWALFDFIDQLPARPDALTLRNWLQHKYHYEMTSRPAFLAAIAICALAIWKRRRSVALFVPAAAFTYFVFFVWNKWAFANYYFLAGQFSALAAACSFHRNGAKDV